MADGWDPVPWAVDGGRTTGATARLQTYAATGGVEGVVESGDLQVLPLTVPGPGVRVLPGGALVRARATGADQQTYAARKPATGDAVQVAATGSAGPRSDLIVARVIDPAFEGQPPAEPLVGPYVRTEVVPGVSSSATSLQSARPGWSGLVLARVDLPPSTATITAGMVTDLRSVARPRTLSQAVISHPARPYPVRAQTGWLELFGIGFVRVPEWATRVSFAAFLSGMLVRDARWAGDVRLRLEGAGVSAASQNVSLDDNGTARFTEAFADELAVPAAMRGQSVRVVFDRAWFAGTGSLEVNQQSTLSVQLTWTEAAR